MDEKRKIGLFEEDAGVTSSSRTVMLVFWGLLFLGALVGLALVVANLLRGDQLSDYMKVLEWAKGAGLVAVIPYIGNVIKEGASNLRNPDA